ncbi:MAG: hypothetical protein ACR2QT_15725, partial [Woeseiaceae bacterium]
ERDSRIANTVIDDSKHYQQWETRQANLLLPVAHHRAKKPQIIELRKAKIELVHRRSLFKYLRTHNVRGKQREKLLRLFHSTLDLNDAILAEHRLYMLAVSSRISTDHILHIMDDPATDQLLRQYEKAYARFFEMKCYLACAKESNCMDLVRGSMREAQARLFRIRRRIETEPPSGHRGNFEREELLSRSGRYPVLNYLNA